VVDKSDDSDLNLIGSDFRTLVLERISSPLIFSFLISWLIINSKIFLVIFSSLDVHAKIAYLEVYFGGFHHLYYTLLYPFISMVFYVFFPYPQINTYTQKIVTRYKVKLNNDQKEIWGKALVSTDELQDIYARHGKIVTQLKNEIQDLKDREKQLEAQLSSKSELPLDNVDGDLDTLTSNSTDESTVQFLPSNVLTKAIKKLGLSEHDEDVLKFIASVYEAKGLSTAKEDILLRLKGKLATMIGIKVILQQFNIIYIMRSICR
jgi:hypothetical protein